MNRRREGMTENISYEECRPAVPEENVRKDRRTYNTENLIKKTLLDLMQKKPFSKVTVTEVCKKAAINRGTFYIHFQDLEDVLDNIIRDIADSTVRIFDHMLEPDRERCTYPFCQIMREKKEYQAIFSDDTSAGRLLDKLFEYTKENFITNLMQRSTLTYEQADAVLYFQMTGCLSITKRMIQNNVENWEEIRQAIDQFIRAGLQSYFVRGPKEQWHFGIG